MTICIRILKIFAAGFVAFIILNLLCRFYYNVPVLFPSNNGVTDGHLEANFHFIRGVEGFGYGKTNNEGFNNIADYVFQPIDILTMGSSHFEAMQIPQINTTSSMLNKLFEGCKYTYNIGVGSQDFYNTLRHYEQSIKYYNPKGYAVIETSTVVFDSETLKLIANGTSKSFIPNRLKIDWSADPVHSLLVTLSYSFLRKIPFIRLVAFQINTIIRNSGKNNAGKISIDAVDNEYIESLFLIMKNIHKISNGLFVDSGVLDGVGYGNAELHVRPVIIYHPHLVINKDGTVSVTEKDSDYYVCFREACIENDIIFFDMSDIFIKAYTVDHIMPHGFLNSAIGTGHLNKQGHRMIAEALYALIMREEKQ